MFVGFKNVRAYLKNGIVKTDICVKDGLIESFEGGNVELPDNLIVVPGFIEKHAHGVGQFDVIKNIEEVVIAKASEGVTTFYPTTMTMPINELKETLSKISLFASKQTKGAKIAGIHLEGPFISKKYHGAQSEEDIVPGSVELFKELNLAAYNQIKQITLAPEVVSNDLINYLVSQNIVVSIGHSDASTERVLEVEKMGVTSVTHTYNGMSPLHHRAGGVMGGVLLSNLYCELITDLIHVKEDAINVLLKIKGKERIITITDSISLKGKIVIDKMVLTPDNHLAGSMMKLNEAARNLKNATDLTFEEVLNTITINPAQCLNIDAGIIEIGKRADFAIIDEDFNVYMTISGGEVIYKKS